jgi:hypothetical protein
MKRSAPLFQRYWLYGWLANTTMLSRFRGREQEVAMKREDLPFQRHRLYYVILKYAVIAAAVVVALYTVYRLYSG